MVTDFANIAREDLEMLGEAWLLERLGSIFSKALKFVEVILEARGPYDGVTLWVRQTFKAAQRVDSMKLQALIRQLSLLR